jgi:NitT/TauT family transport system substrate-binding protein
VGIAPIVVAPNSPIRKVSDLKGKRIAVNARRNIAELAVVSALEVNNVNVKRDKVKIVPVPFPAMAQTLQKGKVDAAWAVEPFSIIVEQQGARRITETLTGPMAGFPTSSYAISPDYAQKYPNTAAAFKRAISKAVAMADKDSPVEADAVATITKLPKPLVSNMLPVAYVTSTNPVRLQRAADLMFKFRYLKRQVKAQEMIA